MKKMISLLLALMMLASAAGCSNADQTNKNTDPNTSAAPSDKAAGTAATEKKTSAAPSSDGVDVDLTLMSGTMVYSEVLNMQQHPDEYMGKTVKMKGPFNVTELGDNRYFACIIPDATACCSTGIEFVWAGDHSYPEDYPKQNTEITVTGTFTTYKEGKSQYLQLKNADVQF